MIRFIHAADLHLDSPFKGLKNIPEKVLEKIKESTFDSLRRIINKAIEYQVDFVLFSGDIYDIDDRSIKAQVFFKEQMERLEAKAINVFLIHGNHDFLINEDSHLILPSNVFVFSSEVSTQLIETENNKKVAVSGFSYNEKWIEDRRIREYPQRLAHADFHIGLLHGYAEGQSSEHARYAPFSLTELKEKNYDYWALGHIHKRQQLSSNPLVYYSGNSQGRNKKEAGDKGCLLVELTSTNHEVTFIPTSTIIWESLNIDVSQEKSISAIHNKIKSKLINNNKRDDLIQLNLTVSNQLSPSLLKKMEQADFYQSLNDESETFFTYIINSKIMINSMEGSTLSLKNTFPLAWEKAVNELTSQTAFEEETDELYSLFHHSKYLSKRNKQYREEIIQKAMNQLHQDLNDKEGI